ncbi:MAG: FAD-linked oxidase C-terminal domain-containing protein [Planctomycetota bacterium]|nr:FAD-linked oxidase C-terminal domain-containing protein [Planctomycetota bacterium]
MESNALAKELRRILGAEGFLESVPQRLSYESDGLGILRELPQWVLLPSDTEETAKCMALLADEGISIAPRGAGTGLSGGATPIAGGVSLVTTRMRRILEIDPENRTARVQAGVINAELTRAAERHGLFYAPDPSSQMACTLGGNFAENSGGPHGFKYGQTSRHVRGALWVNHLGEIIDLTEPAVDPAGLDVLGLLVGSEGMFGMATELVFDLIPIPESTETLLAIFPTLTAACESVTDLIAKGMQPSAIEILDRLTIEAVEKSVFAAGYPSDAEAVLLMDVDGTANEVCDEVHNLQKLLKVHGAMEQRSASSEEERRKLWAGRKGAYGAMGRSAPDLYVADVGAPRMRLAEIVQIATDICAELDLLCSNVFHAGDGNLHPNISYDRRDSDQVRRVLLAGQRIMEACVERGGSLTGEHGVGLEKRDHMCLMFTDEDLAAQDLPRQALDPNRRMNPGKMLPVRGCREMRTRSPYLPGMAEYDGQYGEDPA